MGQVFKGYYNAGVSTVESGIQMVAHPIQTAEGIATAALHPVKTAKFIIENYKEKSQTLEGQGEIVGEILIGIATGGAAKAATKSAAIGRIGSSLRKITGGVGDDVAELAGKIRNCFPAGTVVATPDGTKRIEDIEPGELVWSYDLIASKWKPRTVLQTFRSEITDNYAFIEVNDETIESTFRHPFWVIEGANLNDRPSEPHWATVPAAATTLGRWVDAGDLQVGDVLLLMDSVPARVTNITTQLKSQAVYNFTVDDFECYAVGSQRVLVHNTNGKDAIEEASTGSFKTSDSLI